MIRNLLNSSLRAMERSRFYTVINLAGLAIGFTAAILIGLYARDELSYERFIPSRQNVYLVAITAKTPTTIPVDSLTSEVWMAPLMRLEFPGIQEVARLEKSFSPPVVQRGNYRSTEQHFYWADPGFFQVLPLRAVAGDLATALDHADGLVITHAIARKFFGIDAPLGRTLLVDNHPLRITAVLEDLPSNTHLAGDFYASSLSAYSAIKQSEAMNGVGDFYLNTLTYIRLKPDARAADIEQRLPQFFRNRMPIQPQVRQAIGAATETGHLVPLTDIHLRRADQGATKPQGDLQVIAAITIVGVLIVVIAAINFVTLMTARTGGRAVEVGIRKAMGASRGNLRAQFITEALIYVAASMFVAASLSELLLPLANTLLQRNMRLDYLGDPVLVAGILVVTVIVGFAAGAYPAFVLSSFRPATVLRGGLTKAGGSTLIRQCLVVVQFAILVALIVVTGTIARQTLFALNDGMRINSSQTLIAFVAPCTVNFRDEVRALDGVEDAGCSGSSVLAFNSLTDGVRNGDQRENLEADPVDFGFFQVYGLVPDAGRLFDRKRSLDDLQTDQTATSSLVINEAAVRTLGFNSANQAVGRVILWHGTPDTQRHMPPLRPAQIIGVVRDFTFDNIRTRIKPTLYYIGPKTALFSTALHVKLNGRNTQRTLTAIDEVWHRVGDGRPLDRVFTMQFMLFRYVDSLVQGAVIAICALLALFIALLGLFALSVFTAEQRTKEIGVRKSMGARDRDIFGFLLWEFTKPVLWANMIAWPLAFWAMNSWLDGFAYHVAMPFWLFPTAGAGTLLVAMLTVLGHAFLMARRKPVLALRYE